MTHKYIWLTWQPSSYSRPCRQFHTPPAQAFQFFLFLTHVTIVLTSSITDTRLSLLLKTNSASWNGLDNFLSFCPWNFFSSLQISYSLTILLATIFRRIRQSSAIPKWKMKFFFSDLSSDPLYPIILHFRFLLYHCSLSVSINTGKIPQAMHFPNVCESSDSGDFPPVILKVRTV